MSFDSGALIQYEDNSVLFTAVIIGEKKGKIVVLNQRGREVELQPVRMHALPGKLPAGVTGNSEKQKFLEKLVADAEAKLSTINPGEIWEFVAENPKEYSSGELTKMYYGNDTLDEHILLRTALIKDRTFFKRDKSGFSPRPAHIVEDLKRAEESRLKKLELETNLVDFLKDLQKDHALLIPPEYSEIIRKIEEVAAYVDHSDPGRHKESRDLVVMLSDKLGLADGGSIEQRAYRLLESTGIFKSDTNLSLIRHPVPVFFPASLLAYIEEMRIPDLNAEKDHRKNLLDRECLTIDDVSTRDMDDALSLVETDSGYEVGIHITDAAYLVETGSPLDIEAKERGTSIYCAERVINMLPRELSEEALSLRAGEVRPCISALCFFDRNFNFQKSEVCASFIKVARRLSYDQVDELLEGDDRILGFLYDAAVHSEDVRNANGAQRVHKREAVPFLESDGSIRLLEIDESSPARLLVSELMVLANSQFANFAAERKIPMLFRGQEAPDELESKERREEKDTPAGPAKDFKARIKLKKSILSLQPVRHAGLGLPAYIQATSPIRRYMDLVHQRQLLSTLKTGKPWVDAEELDKIVLELEPVLAEAQAVNKESKRFWLMRYLEQRDRKATIKGTVVRTDGKSPLVELDEVYLTTFVRVNGKVRSGDELELKITVVDAAGDYLRVECADISRL